MKKKINLNLLFMYISWEFPVCHTKHAYDYNAAVSIMFKDLKIYTK